MQKVVFIIPHFGKFNNYFPLWLHSCKYNPTIDWLIFTDDSTAYNYPENVRVHYTTFAETVNLFQQKFDFKIILSNPYQLCEFKVSYGEVFADYIQDYDLWGHCDTDVIWGNLRHHLPDKVLTDFSKISWRGHFTLYQNNAHINSLYRQSIDGIEFYKYAFANDTGFPLAPDERAVNYIFEREGEKIYQGLVFADLKIRSYNFSLLHFPASEGYKNERQIFLWDNGNLFRLYVHDNQVCQENFAYIHFLKRPMQVEAGFVLGEQFLIVPNRLINVTKQLTAEMIEQLSQQKFYWSYVLSRLTAKYLLSKLAYRKSKKMFQKKYNFVPLKTVCYGLSPTKATCQANIVEVFTGLANNSLTGSE